MSQVRFLNTYTEKKSARLREYRFGIKSRLKNFINHLRYPKNDFTYYQAQWEGLYGWLSEEQGKWLFEMAKKNVPSGNIVEIGSAFGRSAVCLAWGAQLSKNGKVFSVDPHTGGKGFREQLGEAAEDFSSLQGFRRNIRRFHLQEWIVPWVIKSDEGALRWNNGKIRLLFIDAWHTYNAVRQDILHWIPRVAAGGIIAIDDYSCEDIRRAVHDCLSILGINPQELKFVCESMAFFRLPEDGLTTGKLTN